MKDDDEICEHDFESPLKLGRAYYICRHCGKNITLDLVLMMEAEIEAVGKRKELEKKRKEKL